MHGTIERVSVLGRPLAARVRSPGLRAWLARQWRFPEHALPPAPYAIHLDETDAPPPPEPFTGTPVAVPLHRLTLAALAGDDDVWRFGEAASGVQLWLGETESRIAVWGVASENGAATIFAALFVSIAEALRASGLLPLHAAVAVRAGRATVLAGPSGVGKSTTLWRLVRAGWAPLAEDFAWLDPAAGLVYGWDRGLRLRPEARERFAPDVPAGDLRTDPDGKLFLPYERFPHPTARTATLERLAVLERREEESGAATSTLVPLAPRDAARAWWETIGVPLAPAVRDRVAAAIVTLVQRVDAVRLPLGPGQLPLESG